MRRNQFPEIILAPQVLINCNGGGTCQGGQADGVYRYMAEHGLPDETCQNYQARNQRCDPKAVCQNCNRNYGSNVAECKAVKNFNLFRISDFGSTYDSAIRRFSLSTSKAESIMSEIFSRGPVSCTLFATDLFDEYAGGIYREHGNHWNANHIVSLVGWGEENGIPYWIGRNSWGTYWGENGFFRIVRGDGLLNLGIENGCTWATPDIPRNLFPERPLPEDIPYGKFLLNYHDPRRYVYENDDTPNRRLLSRHGRKKVTRREVRPTSEQTSSFSYDIRNLYGMSFASVNKNQNNPLYCESSWAQAATSALNDRFALLKNASHPEVVLSTQVLLNCAKSSGCHGGDASEAYAYIKEHTLPDESCSPYEAMPAECTDIHTCKSCWPDKCYSLNPGEYTPYTITSYGKVSGDDNVMKEIKQNGPVACRICDSSAFLSYAGGVFTDEKACQLGSQSKKFVVLSGWGEKNGVKYWIGRNSWGTFWGEDGWFRVKMGTGDLGITRECHWATPEQPKYRYLYSMNGISGIARIKREFRDAMKSHASSFVY